MATDDRNFHARTLLQLARSLGAIKETPWEKVCCFLLYFSMWTIIIPYVFVAVCSFVLTTLPAERENRYVLCDGALARPVVFPPSHLFLLRNSVSILHRNKYLYGSCRCQRNWNMSACGDVFCFSDEWITGSVDGTSIIINTIIVSEYQTSVTISIIFPPSTFMPGHGPSWHNHQDEYQEKIIP